MNVILHDAGDADRLLELIRRERSARQRDRYRAVLLAAVGEAGREFEGDQIAATLCRSPRFVDKWLARYRTGGLAALHTPRPPGRKPRLSAEQCAQLTAALDAGPPPQSGRSALVGRDIKALIKSRFDKLYSLNGVYALLHRLGYSWLMPRPRHPQADPAAQEEFKKKIGERIGDVAADHPGKRILTYFQDEARFGQKGTLTRLWAKRGSRPTALKQTQYDYLYVLGAVCPSSGESVALLAPYVNTQVMNLFLERFGASLAHDVHAVMILDRAGWHVSKELMVPANVTLILLPPRSPELNPIERLWLWIKSHYWANHAYGDYEAMLDAAGHAFQQTAGEPGRIKSVCRCDYLERTV